MVDPNKEAVFEVICDAGVWGSPNKGTMYQIMNLEEIAAYLDKFALPQVSMKTDTSMVFQIAPEAFVTINCLPLYPLSNMPTLVSGLEVRGYLDAA